MLEASHATARHLARHSARRNRSAAASRGRKLGEAAAAIRLVLCDRQKFGLHSLEKGSGTENAKHPSGRSGFRYLTPFSRPTLNLKRDKALGSCGSKPAGHFVPVHNVPERCDVIRAAVLVVQVVSMFPDVQAQDGSATV
jgi:hypothetical protein